MGLWFIRILFIIIFALVGWHTGVTFDNPYLGAVVAVFVSLFVVFFEAVTHRISLRGLSSSVFGVLLGLFLAKLIGDVVSLVPFSGEVLPTVRTILTLIFAYVGLILGMKGKDEFHLVIPYIRFKSQKETTDIVLVDTSVIIDGRIIDIIKTGFIEAHLYIPRFILKELQTISDSTDPIKRQRGQRGLDILKEMQTLPHANLKIHDQEPEGNLDNDAKLVRLAQLLDAKLLTTDYNLNRVAELEGIKVLNINQLTEALKPVLLPGEKFSLKLVREGKEYNQAVGYLEDGTMVVVENSRWLIGKTVKVEVTSILQGPSGRIIFTKLI